MNNGSGWISIQRDIRNHWLWKKGNQTKTYLEAWMDLLMMVNHEDVKVCHGNSIINVKIGQRITSILDLSKRWKWSRSKVKRFLDLLKKDSMIDFKTDTKKTIITILNYSKYQRVEKQNGHQTDIKRTSNGHQTDTNNNNNNDNNDNKEKLSSPEPGNQTVKKCPQSKIVSLWNETMVECPKIQKWSAKTKRKNLSVRWKEDIQRQDLSWWSDFFSYIRKSDFLMGRKKDFTITLDWLVNPTNFEKVINGNYENRTSTQDNNTDAGLEFIRKQRELETKNGQ